MLVRFWGTRGSLPTSITAADVRQKLATALVAASGRKFKDEKAAKTFIDKKLTFSVGGTYGGASSCVELDDGGEEFLICDLGSGVRSFGLDAIGRIKAGGKKKVFNIFMSHFHWDHIMGFPFFAPAFDPEVTIRFFGAHDEMEKALRRQQEKISFPVPFDFMAAKKEFHTLALGRSHDIAGYRVHLIKQFHDNDSYGFRFERHGKSVVYSTDCEHKMDDLEREQAFVDFFDEADLVIFDTMYTLADQLTMKEDWGHSSGMVAVDLCHKAAARRLVMFHHEPIFGDALIEKHHRDTIRYEELTRGGDAVEILCAYDGMEVSV